MLPIAADATTWAPSVALAVIVVGAAIYIAALRRSLGAADRRAARADDVTAVNAQLQLANEELQAFSYSVSHDLRAPLRAIDGFSRIVLEDDKGTLTAEQRRYLRLVCDSTRAMGGLIDDLLRLSRLASQPLSRVEIATGDLVAEVQRSLTAGEPAGRICFVDGHLPDVDADPALVRQVFANLIQNAIKFTRDAPHPRIAVDSAVSDGEVVFCVSDNGVGFDMRYADKIFDVFQRLHRTEEYEGSGVGLAVVQRIVSRHGGRLWTDARVGEGASFYFTLSEGRDHGSNNARNPARGGRPERHRARAACLSQEQHRQRDQSGERRRGGSGVPAEPGQRPAEIDPPGPQAAKDRRP